VQAIEHGLSSSFEEEAIDARVAKTLEDWEKKSMPNIYDVTDERRAVGREEGAASAIESDSR
jgi:hypothetical protein